MAIADSVSKILLALCLGILVTGGFELRFENAFIELNQPDVFAVLMMMVGFFIYQKKNFPKNFMATRVLEYGLEETKTKAAVLFVGAVMLLFVTRLIRHWTLNTSMVDVATIHQPLFHVFEPKLLYSNANWNDSQLAGHIDWMLIPLGILIGWTKSNLLVFIFKFVVVAGSIWMFLTRGPLQKLKNTWFWFLFIILASKSFRNGLVWDVREDDVAFAAFLMATLSLWKGKLAWYWLSLIVALSCKENMPAVAVAFAAPILWDKDLPLSRKTRHWQAFLTVAVCVVYGVLVFKYLIPHFMGNVEVKNNLVSRFPGLGSTTQEVVVNFLTRPDLVMSSLGKNIFSFDSLRYVVILFLPFIVWARHKLIWIVPAIPGILMNVLSNANTQRMMIFHYEQIILCFLIPAAAFGLAKTYPKLKTSRTKLLPSFALSVGLALCVFGRPPQVEIRQRLFADGHRIPNAVKLSYLDLQGPVASDHHSIAHLSHLDQIRLLQFPRELPSRELAQSISQFVQFNPVLTMSDEARDPGDSRWVVINRDEVWGRWLEKELFRLQLVQTVKEENKLFAVFKLSEFPFNKWCETTNNCR